MSNSRLVGRALRFIHTSILNSIPRPPWCPPGVSHRLPVAYRYNQGASGKNTYQHNTERALGPEPPVDFRTKPLASQGLQKDIAPTRFEALL